MLFSDAIFNILELSEMNEGYLNKFQIILFRLPGAHQTKTGYKVVQ